MNLDTILNVLRAIGEETRLRIMALLMRGELTVSEITQILGQSQPRVSRHLKILTDAGLVDKFREGSWMFYRIAAAAPAATDAVFGAVKALNASGDRVIARDGDRFEQSRLARAAIAAEYFEKNAGEWDTVRSLQIEESQVEQRMRRILANDRVELFVDLGTGTGRMLTVFSDLYESGIGFDLSREMLAVARDNLERAGVAHAQVRHGDLFSLPVETGSTDIVCIHHVLHFLAEPGAAVMEAARLLKPGGRLIISDFAPHEVELLRAEHAHRRLGFPDDEVAGWCASAGLELAGTETLSPRPGSKEPLTVKIWLAQAPEAVRRLNKRIA
ncbi:MAG: metalloregulator ArsR/SmtB family transcription factor [Parvularculaceae bacterium]|nr:metalloregulator ArsR/SmtB family transcription factor [Parvularculaceae bacterium]